MLALFGGIAGIIKALLGFGETVKSISGDIARVRIAAREADTEEKRIEAQTEERALVAKRDVLIAEAPGSQWNQVFRVFISLPAAFLLWKIVVWDIILKWGVTDRLSTFVESYVLAVIGFYLLNRTIQVAKR